MKASEKEKLITYLDNIMEEANKKHPDMVVITVWAAAVRGKLVRDLGPQHYGVEVNK